jgi:hypothetical protein
MNHGKVEQWIFSATWLRAKVLVFIAIYKITNLVFIDQVLMDSPQIMP